MSATISTTTTISVSDLYDDEALTEETEETNDTNENQDDLSWLAFSLPSTSAPSRPPSGSTYDYYAYNSNQGSSFPSNFSAILSNVTTTSATPDENLLNQTTIPTLLGNSDSFAALLMQNFSSSNPTEEIRQHLCDAEDATWMQWERLMLLFCGLSGALLIAILNLCVIITFIRCAEIRIAAQNLYILNLAICDFCVGTNSLPGITIYFFNMCWPFGVPLCQVMTNLDWITSTETGISMCLIAYDRLRLVRLGALYTTLENRTVVVRKIVISWCLVIGFLAPGILMPFFTKTSVNEFGDCVNEIYQHETLATTLYTITGSLPPFLLAVIYVMVYREMTSNVRFNNEREARRQRRAARGMYFLCAVFLASWIPPTIHELVVAFINNAPALQPIRLPVPVEFRIGTFFKFWIYLNSLVNPFLYASAFPAIRAAMEKTFLPQQWHRKLEAKRKLRRSTTTNGSVAGEGESNGSMRKLRTYARNKAAPIGETLRLLYKTGSNRGSSARDATRAAHNRELHTASTTAASTANNSFVQRSTRSSRAVDGRDAHLASNGTLANYSMTATNVASSPAITGHEPNKTLRVPDMVDLLDPITVTTSSTTTTTGGASNSSMLSADSINATNHIVRNDNKINSSDLSRDPPINGPAAGVKAVEHIELVSMKSANTNTTATIHEELTWSPSRSPDDAIDTDDDGTLNMSGDRMLIVTPQGELLLRTVLVNGYTTVML